MTDSVSIILNALTLVACLMAIGFLSLKAKLIEPKHLPGISKLIVNVLLPCTMFSLIVNSEARLSDYIEASPYLLGLAVVYLSLFGLGWLISRALNLQGKKKAVFRMFMVFGNITYFGIPLIPGLYPDGLSVLHLTQHNILDALILWSVGILILSPALKARSFIEILQSLLTPTMIAILLGLVMMGLNLHLPEVAGSVIQGLANSLKSISLVYMGMLLGTISIKPYLKDKSLYLLILIKMILVPLVIYLIASQVFITESAMIMAVMFGLPGMIMVSILAANFDCEPDYAAAVVFMTTLASLVTLPLLVSVLSLMKL